MRITQIKQQLKREDRYSIFVDGKYRFSLSEKEVADLNLHEDQEVAPGELESLLDQAKYSKAYDRALRYIEIRPRSEYEMRAYLKRKDYETELIDRVLERLCKLELLNDRDFAKRWVDYRLTTRPSSKRRLFSELLQKRIDREIISEVLGSIEPETELAQVRELAARKGKLSQYQDRQKLMAYLSRQGFSYDLIKKALAAEE
ncbi:RecX family transcriptional regulator [Candidatus Microgenomates bacterium]|nr:RecX family transcriptional regulator [Candidatus Microgenomates bacterium]